MTMPTKPSVRRPAPALQALFDNNRRWVAEVTRAHPQFFADLARQQAPDYLWIGCSDSRVPANQITGLAPGEVFVHRNVGNVVVHTDLNVLSVIQFAVDMLKVEHIIVCGHHGCSGVRLALDGGSVGLADNWLRHIRDVHDKHGAYLGRLTRGDASGNRRHERLCELNVIEQVRNVCRTTVVRDAWARGQDLTVHGCVYSLRDGLLRDLAVSVSHQQDLESTYQRSVAAATSAATPPDATQPSTQEPHHA